MVAFSVIGTSNALKEATATAIAKAKNAAALVKDTMASSDRSLAYTAHEAVLIRMHHVSVPNDLDNLEITVIDHAYGAGVVIAGLGPGTAMQAGLLVGDVIVEVSGTRVHSHAMALDTMRACPCAELVLTLAGKARKAVIDKQQPGKLEITVTNPHKGAGVVVESVGYTGLAAAAGIMPGDTILSINGKLVGEHAEAIAFMDTSERWVEVVLTEADGEWDVEGRL